MNSLPPTNGSNKISFTTISPGSIFIGSSSWAKGGEGGEVLAREVVRLCEEPSELRHPYELDEGIEGKLDAVATKVYRASSRAGSLRKVGRRASELFLKRAFGNGRFPPFLFPKRAKSLYNCLNPY